MRQLQFLQTRRQRHRGRIARAAAGVVVQTHVNLAVEERPGRQHHRARAETNPHLRDGADNTVAFHHQIVDRLLEQPQVGLILQPMPDRLLIQQAVRLSARRPNGRALGRIQDAELDAALVRRRRHGTAQRVDFLHQMALADAANRRIAAHLAEGFDVVGQQERRVAHARRGQSGFGAGMAAADDDYVKFCGKEHRRSHARSSREPFKGNVWANYNGFGLGPNFVRTATHKKTVCFT